MDPWEVLGLLGMIALWAALGYVAWIIMLAITGARIAPWRSLLIAVLVAIGGAALVPALGLKGWGGLWTSLASALLLSAAAMLLLVPRLRTADA